MAEVFISFIHEEEIVAKAVQEVLRYHLKRPVFMSADVWQVLAGEIWLDRIAQELEEAHVAVLMLSAESVARPWINFEAGAAWLTHKIIIPACFSGLTKGSLPKPYSSIQALNLPEDVYYLVASVAGHLAPPQMAPLPFRPDGQEVQMVRDAIERGFFTPFPPPYADLK